MADGFPNTIRFATYVTYGRQTGLFGCAHCRVGLVAVLYCRLALLELSLRLSLRPSVIAFFCVYILVCYSPLLAQRQDTAFGILSLRFDTALTA